MGSAFLVVCALQVVIISIISSHKLRTCRDVVFAFCFHAEFAFTRQYNLSHDNRSCCKKRQHHFALPFFEVDFFICKISV